MSDDEATKPYPMRLRQSTVDAISEAELIMRIETRNQSHTQDQVLAKLVEFYREHNPTYQEYLKSEALAPKATRS